MDIGMLFDWLGRVFGVVFLLFMLYVLCFPNLREPADIPETLRDERPARGDSQPERTWPAPTPQPGAEHNGGALLAHLRQRRTHR
jgi:hypothetical protein